MKTLHTAHGGKMSIARVLNGQVGDGTTFQTPEREAGRVAGVFKLMGQTTEKRGPCRRGETVALAKLDHALTGDTITAGKQAHPALPRIAPYPPVLAIAVSAKERKDDVKLGQALHKLLEEDPSVSVVHNPEAHEVVAWGQGEMHLRVATERLADRFGVAIATGKPSVGYRETIKKPIQQRGRHKKQSGGHGQYGDIVVDIKPLPRGSGFTFEEAIKGGVVPRNYIPSVEEGVIDALKHGPLGFPVVDVAVKLVDGSYHTVDSSDMAFQLAGRLAMNEGLPQCQPVLLEPIYQVEIVCPSEATAKMNALMSGHRGQILGFDTREGWDGWDVVQGADAGGGDRQPHHRGALGHRRRRQLHLQVRPHGGARPAAPPTRSSRRARRPRRRLDADDARPSPMRARTTITSYRAASRWEVIMRMQHASAWSGRSACLRSESLMSNAAASSLGGPLVLSDEGSFFVRGQ